MSDGLVGVIGGSGLGDALGEHITGGEFVEVDTPFGACSSKVLVGQMGGRKIAFINRHGDGHKLMPSEIPYAANIFALKKLGVRALVSSGAVGSLREEIVPGHLVIVDQFIDKTYKRQSTFFEGYGAVHCELAQPACGRLRKKLFKIAKTIDAQTHDGGTYVCMEGPQFSTRAESLMHQAWGGDLIGMTAMPEAKLAREAQMCYGLISLASDYDCWRKHEANKDKQTLLQEIIGNLKMATGNAIELLKAVLESKEDLCDEYCHCRSSLELAVWTDEKQIDGKDKEKLSVLFE